MSTVANSDNGTEFVSVVIKKCKTGFSLGYYCLLSLPYWLGKGLPLATHSGIGKGFSLIVHSQIGKGFPLTIHSQRGERFPAYRSASGEGKVYRLPFREWGGKVTRLHGMAECGY